MLTVRLDVPVIISLTSRKSVPKSLPCSVLDTHPQLLDERSAEKAHEKQTHGSIGTRRKCAVVSSTERTTNGNTTRPLAYFITRGTLEAQGVLVLKYFFSSRRATRSVLPVGRNASRLS